MTKYTKKELLELRLEDRKKVEAHKARLKAEKRDEALLKRVAIMIAKNNRIEAKKATEKEKLNKDKIALRNKKAWAKSKPERLTVKKERIKEKKNETKKAADSKKKRIEDRNRLEAERIEHNKKHPHKDTRRRDAEKFFKTIESKDYDKPK